MSDIKKTTKHEMTYDESTGQAIFNGRNKTALSPRHLPFPQRMVNLAAEPEIEDNTLVLAPADNIVENTLELNSGTINEHTLEL